MKINITKEIEAEIQSIIERLIKKYPDTVQSDIGYIEISTPFVTNAEARNEEWKTKIGLVFYPELLTYSENNEEITTPWICVRLELENPNPEIEGDLLKWISNRFSEIENKPFYDEDAYRGNWRKEERRGWNKYKMYINPDYPEGYWENHTL
jgi:hypothetical protein